MSIDIEEARARCREYARAGLLAHRVRGALRREGYSQSTIDEVAGEYEQVRAWHRERQQRLVRLAGGCVFAGCTGLFLFLFCFASPNDHIVSYGLLAGAMVGFLKMVLP